MLAVTTRNQRGALVPKFCLEQASYGDCAVGPGAIASAAENHAKYCENYEALNTCLADYFSVMEEIEQSGREIDPYYQEGFDNLRETINNSEALQD